MAKKIAKRGSTTHAARGRLVFERDGRAVWQGDCLAWLAAREPGRFSACVTDPPYELGFMGRKWDKSGVSFDPGTWRAVLRALRPGAHLVAFGGTRTFHRIACAIEDGGFEIRDTLMWVYGQGFSKSLDVSKAIDKAAGAKRKVTGTEPRRPNPRAMMPGGAGLRTTDAATRYDTPATPEAARWQGWGTGLKPAWEPIILARKPLDGTVAECVLRHGTGALNVDGCRIGTTDNLGGGAYAKDGSAREQMWGAKAGNSWRRDKGLEFKQPSGRWPPNAVFQHDARCVCVGTEPCQGYKINRFKDGAKPFGGGAGHEYESEDVPGGEREVYACVPGCPVRMLDGQSGQSSPSSRKGNKHGRQEQPGRMFKGISKRKSFGVGHNDSGGASRFFYTSKASTAERRAGLSMLEDNAHPTVKPVALMEWLLRLVTPPGGEVLDPFAGSGSTLVAAKRLGIPAVGIDLDAEACETAAARLTRRTVKGLGGTKKLKLGKRRRRK